jgi:hypothetical protein
MPMGNYFNDSITFNWRCDMTETMLDAMEATIRDSLPARTVSDIEEYFGSALFNMHTDRLALIYALVKGGGAK